MQQEEFWSLPEKFGRIDVGGFTVEAVDGKVGKVDRATLDPGSSYLIVDKGPPVVGKKLLLPAGVVTAIDRDDEIVYLACTEDELKHAPAFDPDRQDDPIYRDQVAAYYAAGADRATEEAGADNHDTRAG